MVFTISIDDNIISETLSERVRVAMRQTVERLEGTAKNVLTGQPVSRNELARLAGVASTSVKTALSVGKCPIDIAFPDHQKKTTIKLTDAQIAAIKAAGIEI